MLSPEITAINKCPIHPSGNDSQWGQLESLVLEIYNFLANNLQLKLSQFCVLKR